MFFTRIGRILAIMGLVFGTLRVVLGFLGAMSAESLTDSAAFAQRYLASPSTGAAIDSGIRLILISVALGIATEISRSLARN